MSGADLVWLQRMPETLPDGTNPLVAEAHAHHTDNAHAATPLPATFAAFVAGRSRAYFADTRRKRRKLERLGPVVLEIAESSEHAATIVDMMLRQKRRRIAESGGRELARHTEDFYRALAGVVIPDGRPHVACLRVDGEMVATHVGVVYRDRFYWLMPGYQAGNWARYSVGRVLLQSLVEWCIAVKVKTFDLTVGDEDYKRFWANTRLRLVRSHYALTLRGAGFLAGNRLKAAAARGSRPLRALIAAIRPQRRRAAASTTGPPEVPSEPDKAETARASVQS